MRKNFGLFRISKKFEEKGIVTRIDEDRVVVVDDPKETVIYPGKYPGNLNLVIVNDLEDGMAIMYLDEVIDTFC